MPTHHILIEIQTTLHDRLLRAQYRTDREDNEHELDADMEDQRKLFSS